MERERDSNRYQNGAIEGEKAGEKLGQIQNEQER